MVELSLVIPVHNEVESVRLLNDAICEALANSRHSYEAIFVDDASTDGTFDELQRIVAVDPHVRVVSLVRNLGQTAALRAGIQHSAGEIIITMDGDLQNDPADIPSMVSQIRSGSDMVTGWRKNRQDRLFSRVLPSKIANWCVARLLNVRIHDTGCALKAYRADLIRKIPLYSEFHRYLPAMCTMATDRITEVVVTHHSRQFGKSKYGLSRIGRVILDVLAIKMLISCAQRPLRWFGAWSLLCFILAVFSAIGTAVFDAMPGRELSFVLAGMSVLLAFLAVHLVFCGVLGELVVRTSERPQQLPVYDILGYDHGRLSFITRRGTK